MTKKIIIPIISLLVLTVVILAIVLIEVKAPSEIIVKELINERLSK